MSWSFAVLDKGAFDNDMATPIAESAEHSEVSTTSPIAENVEQSKVSTADLIAENAEHSENSTTSPIAENVDQPEVSNTSLISKNAEHSEGSATSLIAKDVEQFKVFTPSLIAKNTDLSEVLTTSLIAENAQYSEVPNTSLVPETVEHSKASVKSPNTGKPEQSPVLMNSPTVEELNACMDSKATTSGSEPEGDEEVAAALSMDSKITSQVVADASNAKANNEDVASAGMSPDIEEFASALVITTPDSKQAAGTPTTKSVSEVFLDMNHVPGEIRKRIIMFAMTAEEGKLEFSNGVGPFKPNVATGLLRANREIYHDAREFLHSQNNFIFNGCGSELRSILDQPHGLWACKIDGCERAGKGPQFSKVTIVLGDDVSMDVAGLKLQTTKAALESIRGEVSIKMLHIQLRNFCWVSGHNPEELETGLSRLNVGALGMFGADYHWHEDLRIIARAVKMNVCPAYLGSMNGFFECGYLPAFVPGPTEESEEDD